MRGTGKAGEAWRLEQAESLPRARDGDDTEGALTPEIGITPACAGRGRSWGTVTVAVRNHSRVRGTGGMAYQEGARASESLPRARDGGSVPRQRKKPTGITPACAGRGKRYGEPSCEPWNHSRVRGTGFSRTATLELSRESLPRARDGASLNCFIATEAGITPACAGRGDLYFGAGATDGNHSRVRGTGTPLPTRSPRWLESLPRARDGETEAHFPCAAAGITPACAGRGASQISCTPRPRNHSRVRGTGPQ